MVNRDLRASRGFSLIEAVITMFIFGVVIWILVSLESQLARFDRKLDFSFHRNPHRMQLVARFRRDVADAQVYPATYGDYAQTPETLLLRTASDDGEERTIVWDFTAGTAPVRIEFADGEEVSRWRPTGMPKFIVSAHVMPDTSVAVRLQGIESSGALTVDAIAQPRAQ